MITEKQREKLDDLLQGVGEKPVEFTVGQLKRRLGVFSTNTLKELLLEAWHRNYQVDFSEENKP